MSKGKITLKKLITLCNQLPISYIYKSLVSDCNTDIFIALAGRINHKADINRNSFIFGIVNDGIAGEPGVLHLTFFNDQNPCFAMGCNVI